MHWQTYYGIFVTFSSFCTFFLINVAIQYFELTPHAVAKHKNVLKTWKWKNILISFIHSVITGTWSILCFYQEPKLAEDVINTFTLSAYSMMGVSLGYFLYDTMDMLIYNRNRQSYELIFHHTVITSCFWIAIFLRQYIGYATVALLVEVNSVFLHLRQLLQLLELNRRDSFYRLNSLVNLGTFIVFRIATLAWMTRWIVLLNRDLVPIVLYYIGIIAVAIMNVMNIILLYRLLQSDFISSGKKKELNSKN